MLTSSEAELFDACGILFDPKIEISHNFLRYLRLSDLRAAYRKKALETHPDRAKTLGKDKAEMNVHFIKATLAYEKLSTVINDGGPVLLKEASFAKKTNKKTFSKEKPYKKASSYFFNGKVPKRKLLLGQFLYYSGCISWNTCINAVVWQRRQRPHIGQIALDWEMISAKDIHNILKGRDFREKFGESAIRRGYLTPYKLMALLGKQRSLQPPIGEYFVRHWNLTTQKMEEIVGKQHDHNRKVFWGNWR
ncbi:MAG: J domain-containing protein [Deltaproteobacteria bacterium]|nr:J domain-containing protein [Deltaproteobacteria bacterium]